VRQELSRAKVTRRLVWEEYRREHPDGYGYSQFCERYRRWLDTLDPVLRQHHAPGEALFVDWAGQTIPVLDPNTGEERRASLFVATLGFSNFLYAEAFFDQKVGSWISAHIHAYGLRGRRGSLPIILPEASRTAEASWNDCLMLGGTTMWYPRQAYLMGCDWRRMG
jgi:transposase